MNKKNAAQLNFICFQYQCKSTSIIYQTSSSSSSDTVLSFTFFNAKIIRTKNKIFFQQKKESSLIRFGWKTKTKDKMFFFKKQKILLFRKRHHFCLYPSVMHRLRACVDDRQSSISIGKDRMRWYFLLDYKNNKFYLVVIFVLLD